MFIIAFQVLDMKEFEEAVVEVDITTRKNRVMNLVITTSMRMTWWNQTLLENSVKEPGNFQSTFQQLSEEKDKMLTEKEELIQHLNQITEEKDRLLKEKDKMIQFWESVPVKIKMFDEKVENIRRDEELKRQVEKLTECKLRMEGRCSIRGALEHVRVTVLNKYSGNVSKSSVYLTPVIHLNRLHSMNHWIIFSNVWNRMKNSLDFLTTFVMLPKYH